MRPEEDLPPSWLRDYGDVEADIRQMEDLATQLDAEVKGRYMPHLDLVDEAMVVELPPPNEDFPELVSFMKTHHTAQELTTIIAHLFRDATGGFALAAAKASKQYRGVDAFAAARVNFVRHELDQTSAARVPSPGAAEPSDVNPTTPPPPAAQPDNAGNV